MLYKPKTIFNYMNYSECISLSFAPCFIKLKNLCKYYFNVNQQLNFIF